MISYSDFKKQINESPLDEAKKKEFISKVKHFYLFYNFIKAKYKLDDDKAEKYISYKINEKIVPDLSKVIAKDLSIDNVIDNSVEKLCDEENYNEKYELKKSIKFMFCFGG